MGISVYNLLILEGLGFKSLLWPWADRRSENQLLLHLENGAVVPLCGVFVRIKRNDPEESSRSRHSCLLWSRSQGGPAGSHQNCSVSCSGVRLHSDILWGENSCHLCLPESIATGPGDCVQSLMEGRCGEDSWISHIPLGHLRAISP